MGETRQLVSQAEYARHRGKSRQYISRLAKAGVLVMRGGKVDLQASDAVLDDRPDETTAVPSPDAGQPATSYAQAKLADMVFRAKLRRLEFETRQGKLIEAETVKTRWASILVEIKERILAMPDRLAPEVTALTDERQVREALKREMHALLNLLRSDVQYAR
jgi:phage terminase Nu1 subunit (DNA packaging protein)